MLLSFILCLELAVSALWQTGVLFPKERGSLAGRNSYSTGTRARLIPGFLVNSTENIKKICYADKVSYLTIQAALNACGQGGTVVVTKSQAVTGSSISISHANETLSCAAGVVLTRGFNSDLVRITGVGATVDGCILDGNYPVNRGNSVLICQTPRCRVSNNTIRNGSNIGVYIASASDQIPGAIISNNRIYSNLGIGIYGERGASNATVSNNIVDTTGASLDGVHDIAFHSTALGQNVSGVVIANNVITNGGRKGFCIEVGGFLGDKPDTVTIVNNDCKASANHIAGGYSVGTASDVTVKGNTFNNNGLTFEVANFIAGIELVSVTTQCTVHGNSVTLGAPTGGQGISIDRSSGCYVTGNAVNGWGPFSARAAAIKLSTSVASSSLDDNVIESNALMSSGHSASTGIWIQCNHGSATCSRNRVEGNDVRSNGAAGSFCYKTELDAGSMDGTSLTRNSGRQCDVGIHLSGEQTNPLTHGNLFEEQDFTSR